jgi:1-acyl-sn-glycerol-3-phosphate acyltransferase
MRYDVDSIDNRDVRAVERMVSFLAPVLEALFHPVVRGLDRIPPGPGLYVANHNGGVLFPDAYVFGSAVHRARGLEDLPYVLAHDLAIRPLISNRFFAPLGGVRASPENATKLFASGRKVLVFPGGDVEALRPFRDRNRIVFGAHRGYVRLAIESGVPILPVVSAGAHSTLVVLDDGRSLSRWLHVDRLLRVKVFPIVVSVPWGLTIGVPPPYLPLPTRIFMEVLPAVRFEREGAEAARDDAYVERCHERVVEAMQSALTRLAADRAADKRARNVPRLDALASTLGLRSRSRRVLRAIARAAHFLPMDA